MAESLQIADDITMRARCVSMMVLLMIELHMELIVSNVQSASQVYCLICRIHLNLVNDDNI